MAVLTKEEFGLAYTGYKNSKYYDANVKYDTARWWGYPDGVDVPRFDTPITARENFRRAVGRNNPCWMPNPLTDAQPIMANDVMGHMVDGKQIHSDMSSRSDGDYNFRDWFNTEWTWVQSAGGAMLRPGTQCLSDILNWEKEIVWPDLTVWGFEEKAAWYMREVYNPDKAHTYNMGRGLTERLVSLLGGYTETMIALAVEPEAVRSFFERLADFIIDMFDVISSLYPLDMVTMHDDWGTEKDTFFSEKMMEELVFEPTKRIVDHVKSRDIYFELHSCGNVTRFLPYMVDLGIDVVQLQRRAVDLPAMKAKYGNKIGYCTGGLEGLEFGVPVSVEEFCEAVRRTVDIYGPGGGSYASVSSPSKDILHAGLTELYCYSRELYDAEHQNSEGD